MCSREFSEVKKMPRCCNCLVEKCASKLKCCSLCEEVRYCSKKCQKEHWKGGHKNSCRKKNKPCSMSTFFNMSPPLSSKCSNADTCPICMDCLSCESSRLVLPCQHTFHKCCVDGLRSHGVAQVCPICRADLPPGPEKVWEEATRKYFNIECKINKGEFCWNSLPSEIHIELQHIILSWREAAESGCINSQISLGNKFMEGMGSALEPNEEMAEFYLTRAADQGNSQAQYNLGTIFFHRFKKECDRQNIPFTSVGIRDGVIEGNINVNDLTLKERIARLWSLAAAANEPRANYNLGLMYWHGCLSHNVPNKEKAMYLFNRAAELGHTVAQECLESMRRGENVNPKCAGNN